MTEHCVRLLGAHKSRKFRGKVISVEAAGSRRAEDRRQPWWADLAQGGVEAYWIDCVHEEMNVEPVLSIGKIVSDVFARHGSARQSALESSVSNI